MDATLRTNLMMVEYACCRYDKVIQIYNDIQISPENEKKLPLLDFASKLFGQLAILRLDASNENKEGIVSLIDTHISERMNDTNMLANSVEVVRIMRNLKEYDAAIDLGEKLGRMSEERHIDTFENAVSHLERYRAVYHRQRDGEFTNDVWVRVHDACNNLDIVRKNVRLHRGDAYLVMFAQKDYLCHHIDDKQKSSELFGNAINFIERYIE